MIYKQGTRAVAEKENLRGGNGKVNFDYLLGAETLGKAGSMFAQISLEPGSSIGVHKHEGEFEAYYILKGEADYNDNGVVKKISAGDVVCCPDGEVHGITNSGKETLVFVAFIGYPNGK